MTNTMCARVCNANCLAKALYDNVAEAPDELAFRKGDILTVLEQNTNNLEGWWLCSLRGRQGIVPGNRLRLLPGMYDPTGLGNGSPAPGTDLTLHALRRSWTSNPNKVVTPQKIGAVYLYDVPVGSKLTEREILKSSTIPSRYPLGCNSVHDSHVGSYDTPPSPRAVRQDAYDEPRPHPACHSPLPVTATYDSPKSNVPISDADTVGIHDYDIPSGDQISTYDVPRSAEKEISNNVSHIITITDNYDTPQHQHKNSPPIYDGRAFSRSSGDTSTSSSFRSPSGSHSSMETLSLSSVSGSNRSSLEQHPNELYDIPPEPHPVLDPKLIHSGRIFASVPYQSTLSQETYDVPTNNAPAQFYDSPVSRPVRALFEGAYDVPPQAMRDCSPVPRTDVVDAMLKLSLTNTENNLDRKGLEYVPDCCELPLELAAAVEMLVKYQQEVQGAISKLFSYVCTTWRKQENIEAKVSDIEKTCHRIESTLLDFLKFAQGALANSVHADDKTLSLKLHKLVKPLGDSYAIVKTCVHSLDKKGWIVQSLARSEESNIPDELDQLVTCSRGLVEDVRQIASFIQGNSALLFKSQGSSVIEAKSSIKPPVAPKPELKPKHATTPGKLGPKVQERPLPPTPAGLIKQPGNKEYLNEYDYVNLESKEAVERENEAIKANLPKDMCQSFDELVKQSEVPVANHVQETQKIIENSNTFVSLLDYKDTQLLHFYGEQVEVHIMHLTNAIDAFLLTIKNNQPPKVFVGHSKFIIISAHKLIFIGDTVHRNIGCPELKTQVMQHSNSLCDSLKTLVNSTKKAASEFPSVIAVQEMVDSVVDVSHLANNLKLSIIQPSKA